jgi:ADP-heptose:LPS heptosyltransferase
LRFFDDKIEDVEKIAVIHTGCEKEHKTPFSRKRWSNENWYKLAYQLEQNFGYSIFFIGLDHDRLGIESNFNNLIGMTNLQESAYVISKANMFIGTDGGMAHLAGVLNVPTYVLFGPTRVQKNKPLGKNVHVIQKDIDCSPCQYEPHFSSCKEFVCMGELSTEDVLNQIDLS